jgi:hypothetical protein
MSITVTPYFTPTSIAGCQLWLDGADPAGNGVIPANGATVSTWVDKSGNGLTVSAASSQPTYSTNAVNSLGTVSFNGSQSLNAGSVTGAKLIGNTGNCAIFVVMRVNNSPGRSMPFSWDDGTYTARLLVQYDENSILYVDKGPFPDNRTTATISLSTTLYYIFSYSQNGSNTTLKSNGNTIGSLTNFANNSITSSTRIFNVGSYVNGSDWNMKGNTAEIIFFNTHIPNNFQEVESYLAQKWGLTSSLPAGHPGIISTVYKTPIIRPLVTIPYTAITYSFAPTQIAGCSLWLDGADPAGTGVAPALNASISTWADKSGLGNTATNQGGAGTVTYTTAGLVFNGSGYFYIPGLAGNIVNKPFVVFMVETLNTTNQCTLLGDDAQTNYGTDNVLHILYRNTSDLAFGFFADDLEDTVISGTGNKRLWAFYLPLAANRVTRRNGAVDVTHGNYNRLNYFTTPSIGRSFGGNTYIGTISEVIIYPSDIGLTAIQKVEAYLGQKWGLKSSLAAGHPGLTTDYYISQSIVNRAALTAPTRLLKIPV